MCFRTNGVAKRPKSIGASQPVRLYSEFSNSFPDRVLISNSGSRLRPTQNCRGHRSWDPAKKLYAPFLWIDEGKAGPLVVRHFQNFSYRPDESLLSIFPIAVYLQAGGISVSAAAKFFGDLCDIQIAL